jgi:hypothetical protein
MCCSPRFLRRLAAVLLLLVGGAGVALSAAAIAACWAVLPSLSHRASEVSERAERLLSVTADSLERVQASLRKASADLGAIKEAEKAPPHTDPAKQLLRRTTSRKLAEQLSPDLGETREKLTVLADVAVVANSLLEGFDEGPLAHKVPLQPEQFQDAERHLTNLTRSAQKLQALLGPQSESGRGIDGHASEMQDTLARVGAKVDDLSDHVAQARDRTAGLRRKLLHWAPLAQVAATVLFSWIGVGQLSLLVYGWSLYRKPVPSVARNP